MARKRKIPPLSPSCLTPRNEKTHKNSDFRHFGRFYITPLIGKVVIDLIARDVVLSVSYILEALSERYGYDFKENFAISDDVFQQIATQIDREHRGWNGVIFGNGNDANDEGKKKIFIQYVETHLNSIFSYEDYHELGKKTMDGPTTTGQAIAGLKLKT